VNSDTATQMVRRTLFDSALLRVGHVVARPSSPECGEIERQSMNLLVLPTTGVFAKHDGPRRHVIATSNHAVLISADSPYRLSFPACIGDQALTLQFSSAALARVLPQAMSRDGFDSSAYATRALLAPPVMLARSLLFWRLARGEVDPLETEELSIGLLVCALRAARKGTTGRNRRVPRDSSRRWWQVERVKEAISTCPERKWTLGELADVACVSPFHLAHVFREEVGTSVYRYVLRSRLAKTLGAVLESDADLTAVALETGFASHSHFTARFRELFGLTPTDLRRSAGRRQVAELRKIVTARSTATA
jgi:AraC family transcriptional regulator